MINFLCDSAGTSSIIIYVVLIVVLVAMLVLPYFTQRRKNQEYMKMINSVRVGDLVKTAGGVIGRVTKIIDKGEIKTVILETGSKSEKSYMEFDLSMIYCVLQSSKVEEENEVTEVDETKPTEDVVEASADAEEAKVEEPKAEKPAETDESADTAVPKKTTRKKSAVKKSSK